MIRNYLALIAFVVGGCLLRAGVTFAQPVDDLLPVEQAFKISSKVATPGTIGLHWDIAPHYYLYRGRIKAKTTQPGVTLGNLALPDGVKKHDEYIGDVEVYHDHLDATLPYQSSDAALGKIEVTIVVQGCHEVDPKICYPPNPVKLSLDVPATAAAAAAMPSTGTTPPINPLAAKLEGATLGTDANMPLPPEQAFVFEVIAQSPTELLARWTMPKGYYLYRDKSTVSIADGTDVQLGAPQWPQGVAHKDEHFGDVTVYFDQVELPIPLQRKNGEAESLNVHADYQGCQDNGICYPVMTRDVSVDLPPATAAQLSAANVSFTTAPTANASPSGSNAGTGLSDEQALASKLSTNRWLALLIFFGSGLLLAFTPCVFPMIPILSGIIAGSGDHVTTRRAFVLSVVYVLATCVVFTVAGVIAGLVGANLQAAFQKPWILVSFAAMFVLLSLSMFGFYELQLPSTWQSKIANISNQQKGGSLIGVAIMGLLSALIVGPCVAPPLAAAVLYISESHSPVFGGVALFVLSLGMGAPLVVFGTAAGKLLPRAGGWMDTVKAVFGFVFLGLAIWMLSRILDSGWVMLLAGVLAIGAGVYFLLPRSTRPARAGWRGVAVTAGIVLIIAGAIELIGAATGRGDLVQPLAGFGGGADATNAELTFKRIKSTADLDRELAAAATRRQPVMLDFYADWCVSCKEMERLTFTQPAVHKSLANFALLQADVTANDDVDAALMKRFGLFGPPATIFFGASGEQRALRLIGFEKADAFVDRVDKVTP